MKWLTSLSDAASFLTNSKLDELTASLLNGNIKLIYLEPSQGAELAILCKDFQISHLSSA